MIEVRPGWLTFNYSTCANKIWKCAHFTSGDYSLPNEQIFRIFAQEEGGEKIPTVLMPLPCTDCTCRSTVYRVYAVQCSTPLKLGCEISVFSKTRFGGSTGLNVQVRSKRPSRQIENISKTHSLYVSLTNIGTFRRTLSPGPSLQYAHWTKKGQNKKKYQSE